MLSATRDVIGLDFLLSLESVADLRQFEKTGVRQSC